MAIELAAERRTETRKDSRAVRKTGRMLANIYGGPLKETVAITLDQKSAERTLRENGKSAEYTVSLDGTVYPVRIQEVQVNALRKQILHVDFVVTNG
jgi:ribosomal protein L25 (general stress protein Ctc)